MKRLSVTTAALTTIAFLFNGCAHLSLAEDTPQSNSFQKMTALEKNNVSKECSSFYFNEHIDMQGRLFPFEELCFFDTQDDTPSSASLFYLRHVLLPNDDTDKSLICTQVAEVDWETRTLINDEEPTYCSSGKKPSFLQKQRLNEASEVYRQITGNVIPGLPRNTI